MIALRSDDHGRFQMRTEKRIIQRISGYNRMTQSIRLRLLDQYPSKFVWNVLGEAREEYIRLIPEIPYIGERHIWQSNLEMSIIALAFFKVLHKQSFLEEEAAEVVSNIFKVHLSSYSKLLRVVYRQYFFSSWNKRAMRMGAIRSQGRQFPGDWEFDYLDGGKEFDLGVDIHECAIMKLFRRHNAEGKVPLLCSFDALISDYFGLGFFRRDTLANGAQACDCRWKLIQ